MQKGGTAEFLQTVLNLAKRYKILRQFVHSKDIIKYKIAESKNLLHAKALLFTDSRSWHVCQRATAAGCGHSSCRSADIQLADHRPQTQFYVCGPSHTDTSHQEDLSSSRCHAQRRTSPAALSVKLCHRRTIWRRWTSYWESYTREQHGRLKYSDQAQMALQTYQFYTTVTFSLCGTKRPAA